jgi:NADPH-dependent curcumin reductase CurA
MPLTVDTDWLLSLQGSILDLMLARLKKDGIVAACGAISVYNDNAPTVLKSKCQPS